MKKICLALLVITSLHAKQTPDENLKAWFTGPQIAPIGSVVPYGEFSLYPMLFMTTTTGFYNQDWKQQSLPNLFSLSPQLYAYFGITSWADFELFPIFFYNSSQGKTALEWGDLNVGLGFQLYPTGAHPWFPGIKFIIAEIFPTGKYQRLSPEKGSVQRTGAGSFSTSFELVFYKEYHISGMHFLSLTMSANYIVTTPVHVNGFHVYGGGYGTHGTVLPGNTFQGIISFDFSLSRNWAISLDNIWTHVGSGSFCGEPGIDRDKVPLVFSNPSSEQLSFDTAIEYNWNENLGLSAGCWFTAAGRNSKVFRSAVLELYYLY